MMEENLMKKFEEILALKLEQYGFNPNTRNFLLPSEMTVTITLDEYRALVSERAEYKEKYLEKSRKVDELNKLIQKESADE